LFKKKIVGFLAPEVVNLLKRVQKVIHSNVVSLRSMNVGFQILGFAVQKGLAAQLVALSYCETKD
jgi:hypothetical protein